MTQESPLDEQDQLMGAIINALTIAKGKDFSLPLHVKAVDCEGATIQMTGYDDGMGGFRFEFEAEQGPQGIQFRLPIKITVRENEGDRAIGLTIESSRKEWMQ